MRKSKWACIRDMLEIVELLSKRIAVLECEHEPAPRWMAD